MKRLISSVLITFLLMNCMCVTISATDVIEGPVSIKDEYIKNFVNDTPPENLFRVAGDDRRFILLDTDLSNESSAFYVLSNELYGTAFFDTSEGAGKPYNSISNPSSGQKFDPSSQTNIANWLNGEFKNSGNIYNGTTYKLPQSIIDNIDINHVWRTECGDDTTNCSQNLSGGNKYFDVSTGISLMSMNEFEKYSGKYGVLDKTQDTLNGGNGNGWWLRTCNRGGTTVLRHVSANPGKIGAWDNGAVKTNRKLGVRPQFYLNKNFFKSVKIDAFNVGKNVKKAILSTCTESELSNLGYTKMEIESLKDVSVNSDNEIRISRDSTLSSIDKAPIVKVRIGNMNKGSSTYTIKYGATGTSDKEVKFDMKYLEIIEKDCVFDFAKEGIYTTNIEIKCNDNVVANFSPKVSFIKSNATNNNFDFSSKGVATHFSFGNTESKDIDYLKASGIKTVRDEILWKSVEKAFGVYDFGFSDTYINQLSQNGIEFIAVLGYENPLYCEGAPKEERAIAGFAKYAAETAKHYPMIKTFEVWNEPDLKSFWGREPSPAEYVALVKATSEAIRKVRPDAMIYGGVTTCTSFDYMNEIMNLGMYDYVEGVSYHPYVWPQTADDGKLEKLMDSHTAIVNENGGFKNIGISETGWPTHVGKDGSGEQKQAVQIVKELVISDEKAIDYNTIYDFRNDGTDESNVEHNFGIIHKDFMPKLAYFAFKNFNDIMSGAKYYGKIRLSDYATGYVYNKQGKPVVVAWGRNENNPIATTSGVSGINVYGDSVACNFVGTEPIYLIGMETSVLIEAASSNAVKSYEKFKALISPKLSSNASTKNIGQMINTQINLLESIESIKIADSKAVLDLLEQNQVIGERIIDGYYKNENGLSINEVSLALSILADGSLCIADLYSISQGASGTLKHTSETAIKKAEKTIENLTSAQSIFARAMIKQAKEISTISAKLELNSTMPNMANSYDMVATNLAVWGEKIVNINAEGDFFNITIKNGKMNIVGDVGTSDKMVTLEIFKPGFNENNLQSMSGEEILTVFDYIGQVDMNTNGILNFSYKMSIKEGEYTVRVLNGKGSEIYKTKVYYLPENVKINIFESVRSATSKNDVLDIIINNIKIFTKSSELFEMAKPSDYDTVATKLFAKKDEILTFDDMINLIDDTLILKVLCTTIDSGEVLKLINDYSHVLGLNNTEAYKTYQSAYVTEDIKSLIVSRLLKSDVDTIEKWRQRFNETVLISTIEKTGYKDIMSVLTLNPSLGLNFSEYYKLSYDEKILVHTAFAGIKYASLADIKTNFDIAVINVINNRKEPSKPSNNGGGGGGNGGGMNGEVSVNGGQASIPDPTPTDDIFIDINDVLWAKDSIENLYKLKIINGKSDKIFEPLSNVTRAEFLKMLMISLDLVDETATSDFKDVEKADWFYTYIASAQKLGITTGKSEIEFGVDDNISREEIAVFVDRALKIPTPNEDEIIFLDSDSISEFAKKSVARLQNTNIVKGDENNCFNPLDFATRAETAVIINRLLNL